MPTSLPLASDLGIPANGSDQTAALNAVFLNPLYAGIVIDYSGPAAITITGTVNAQGKLIRFAPGSNFAGGGTINDCKIDADYAQQCFERSITVNPIWTTDGKFSALWGYSSVIDSGNYQPAFQWAIDTVVRNQTKLKIVYFPGGTYAVNSPLNVYAWNGSDYDQTSITLKGDSTYTGPGITTLNFGSLKTGFGINIQKGKGSVISGLGLVGGFTPPNTNNDFLFYQQSLASFTDGVSRDTRYSPNAGVVIDAFSPSIPPDGGYPTMTAWYRGSGTNGGSTGVLINDCYLSNWVVCIVTSPNAFTQNAELIKITNCNLANYKIGIGACQAQEKLNEVSHIQAWGNSHTFFDNSEYGAASSGNWFVESVNMAGKNIRFCYGFTAGQFPTFFRKIYAESIRSIGVWSDGLSGCMEDCIFDFALPVVSTSGFPDWTFDGMMTFRNCAFRYYGKSYRCSFHMPSPRTNITKFVDCKFEAIPYTFSAQENVGGDVGLGNYIFENCFIGAGSGGFKLGHQTDYLCQTGEMSENYCYGNYRIWDVNSAFQNALIVKGFQAFIKMQLGNSVANVVVTLTTGNNTAVVTPNLSASLASVLVGDTIAVDNGKILGIVAYVGASSFVVNYVNEGITSGSYHVYLIGDLHPGSFLGTVISGNNTITNVINDLGNLLVAGNFLQIPGFYNSLSYPMCRILSYNSGAATLTIDRASSASGVNIYFSNCGLEKQINNTTYFGAIPSGILPKGAHWFDDRPANGGKKDNLIIKTGYYSGTPQAAWIELTGLGNPFAYTIATAVNTSNYIVTAANYVNLTDLTGQANRSITLPSTPLLGQMLIFRNINMSTFNWSFAGGVVRDVNGNTVTILVNPSVYELVYNGTNWEIAANNNNLLLFETKTANYTLVAPDAFTNIQMDIATANTVTVPPDSSVAFPVGTNIIIEQSGVGTTTIVAGAGVTLQGLSLISAGQYSTSKLIKQGANTWLVS